ncbi:MAG: STAS domain-containing protein [Desulfonauticus sp.]|nr:STAS domain-containing protein [Desulfonauticus sp.]
MPEQEINFALEGDVVRDKVKEIKENVLKLIQDKEDVQLVLDLKKVSVLDVFGIGLIFACYNSLKQKNGRLKLINVSDELKKLFDMLELDKYLELA